LVVVDAAQFICVYDSEEQVGFVPWLCVTEEEAGHPDGFRRCAQRVWKYWCGQPPKGLASAVLNSARKVIRIGLCILFVATVRIDDSSSFTILSILRCYEYTLLYLR
jgi:hypothetical protein